MRKSLSLLLFMSLFACAKEKPAASVSAARAPSGMPPLSGDTAAPAPAAGATAGAPAPAEPAGARTLTGKVVERIDAPPYSYLRLDTAGGEQWAAVSQADIKNGEQVTIADAMVMDGFESKTLKRKFDKIVFGTLATGGAAPSPAPAAAAPPPSSAVHGSADKPGTDHTKPAAVADVKVPKAEGAGAMTIAEIFAGKATLKDKPVLVRGKVVKYNGGIMGKNWLHIQDGSGSEAAGDHDIAVTTTDEAKVGDVVTVAGPVHLDRDFGAGYAYSVILEDAKLQ